MQACCCPEHLRGFVHSPRVQHHIYYYYHHYYLLAPPVYVGLLLVNNTSVLLPRIEHLHGLVHPPVLLVYLLEGVRSVNGDVVVRGWGDVNAEVVEGRWQLRFQLPRAVGQCQSHGQVLGQVVDCTEGKVYVNNSLCQSVHLFPLCIFELCEYYIVHFVTLERKQYSTDTTVNKE